ncbi:MAG: Ig-like domain-containing protein [Bacteroidales bacterium]|nr:Ig-like domain-containing protein [Bacteroidales bacterium]
MKSVRSLLAAIALMAIAVSCGKEPAQPNVAVTGVTLSPESIDIEIGDQKSLTATVSPSNATNKNISFSSSKESVATVSRDGIVDAVAAGKAIVTVMTEDGKYKAHCTVNVLEKVVHVTGVALNKTTLSLKEGEQFTLVPTVTPDNAADKSVRWSSDHEAIVTVSAEGVVKALKAGKAIVTATTVDQSKTASCAIEVAEGMGAVTGAATHISCRNAEISGKANLPGTTSTDLSFGVLYSTSSGVLIGSAIQIEARAFDSDYNYTVNTEVLEPETTYYYRSYIIQDKEISYGELKSFKTLAVSSMIQTLDATDINPKEAVLNASLDLTDCRYDALEYGFEVTPEGGSAHTLKSYNHSEKKFSAKDESLSRDTKYSVVAYVKLDGRTYKGEAKTFTTTSVKASITVESSNVSYYSATISGRLTVESEGSFTKSAVLYYSSTASTLEALKSRGTRKTLTLGTDGSYSIDLTSIESNTKYNYVVIAKVDDVEFASSVKNFTTLGYQTPELVDLGLSVKWASFNLGATKPEDYGGYYQWAGTTDVTDTRIYLDWSNCPYHTGSDDNTGWTKYVPSNKASYWSGSGSPDNKTVLDPGDDVAHVKLGGKWRMPTSAEWAELKNTDNCSWTWTSINGVKGYKVQSKKTGFTDNWIFLPAAGYRDGDGLSRVGADGSYWSSSLVTGYPNCASRLYFHPPTVGPLSFSRYRGQGVRPVSE